MVAPTPTAPVGPEVHKRLGPYEVAAAVGFGPRVTGLTGRGSGQILARLGPEVRIDNPESGTYVFRGGHRLWAAPEVPSVTYAPDDHHCEVSTDENRLVITGTVDSAGLIKGLELSWDGARLEVIHRLTRSRAGPIRTSPWAITQLPLGGVAVMPVRGGEGRPKLQADRSLVLWPYTDLDDRRLEWRSGTVIVQARPGPALKVGTGPDPVRLGYLRDGFLFVKTLPRTGEGEYPDRAAVGQVFVNEDFCELESLGPLVDLGDGEEVTHRETWEIHDCTDVDTALGLMAGSSSP